jgi:pyruvate-ferredoxin/flavodoxin oxidoreductase
VSFVTLDANEAVASVAHRLSEVVAIYPITPASPMGEHADEWSAAGRTNVFGVVPRVVEMQSEGGAAGALHGALQAGALATTFTASQGLLLMLPDMLKIAGELTPFCMHVAARALATHALSIFGDHSDVMAARTTGFALLCSGSVQEAQDLAAIAHAVTLRARVPFLHFFDGFRTSHEIGKIAPLSDEDLRAMIDEDALAAHRARALTPDRPVLRGTSQNPDVFFQAREAQNPFYDACPALVEEAMRSFEARTRRAYHLFDWCGHPEAERAIVLMGSAAETAQEAVDWLVSRGERVGVVKVRLFRPFDARALLSALPSSVRSIAVLDRTKEPGALGEPLFLDVVAALEEDAASSAPRFARRPTVIGGRYGLASKEVTPAMIAGVFAELARERPRRRFTLGIVDDVTGLSLPWDRSLDIEPDDVVRCVFYGLGSDGTVSSNKQSIKIIGEETPHFAQGYFVYDSKKAGATTVSHLRFGPRPIRSAYLVGKAHFVACHAPQLVESIDVAERARHGATFLLATPEPPERAWDSLPRELQEALVEKRMRFFVVDAQGIAAEAGLGRRISAIMQTCFFALSGVLPKDKAVAAVRAAVERAYGRRGPEIVRRNHAAIDATLAHLYEVPVPAAPTTERRRAPPVPSHAPDFVQRVTRVLLEGKGDLLPVSAFVADGTWPVGTAQWEKRRLALEVPELDPAVCIQCNKCALVCPHAAIRAKLVDPRDLAGAPEGFRAVDFKGKDHGEAPSGVPWKYVLQLAPDDCTGCGLCAAYCPAKDKKNPRHKALDMVPVGPVAARARAAFAFFEALPDLPRERLHFDVKGSQFALPLFEFSGACSGCGETPYLKLLTQLFGDRLVIANATGCSSIYGGNLPTTPWRAGPDGRGPAWSNSLFEDNAEFGLGLRLGHDAQRDLAGHLARELAPRVGVELVDALLGAAQGDEAELRAQRERVQFLRVRLAGVDDRRARVLAALADALVRKSVWIVGGDGWAYDIGFGGLDHVLASGADVNVLVLDTEVYSNTGGQQSKATPLGAVAKFAAAGKEIVKKDLGLLAMTYGHVYVASVAMGAKDAQTVRALREAESWHGPSLIIAYSHCIAHGYDMVRGMDQQRLAVESGVWPLYRFDPRRLSAGEPPLELDAPPPKLRARDYMRNEGRFRSVELRDRERAAHLFEAADRLAARRRAIYEQLSHLFVPKAEGAS